MSAINNGGPAFPRAGFEGKTMFAERRKQMAESQNFDKEQVGKAISDALSADSDDWIGWDGGKCPVPDGTLVDVRYRDGQEGRGLRANEHVGNQIRDAGPAFWGYDGLINDIIAYRVVKGGAA